jgi:hypothetical protein
MYFPLGHTVSVCRLYTYMFHRITSSVYQTNGFNMPDNFYSTVQLLILSSLIPTINCGSKSWRDIFGHTVSVNLSKMRYRSVALLHEEMTLCFSSAIFFFFHSLVLSTVVLYLPSYYFNFEFTLTNGETLFFCLPKMINPYFSATNINAKSPAVYLLFWLHLNYYTLKDITYSNMVLAHNISFLLYTFPCKM